MRFTLILISLNLILFTSVGCAPPAERLKLAVTHEPPVDAHGSSGVYTQNGRPVLWSRLPVTFAFATNAPDDLREACRRAAETFNRNAGRALIRIGGPDVVATPGPVGPRGPNFISFGTGQRSTADEVGSAELTLSRGQIVGAHVDFLPEVRQGDVESSCLHEFGHALGFTHQTSDFSIMHPVLYPPFRRRDLSSADRARLLRHYPNPSLPNAPSAR